MLVRLLIIVDELLLPRVKKTLCIWYLNLLVMTTTLGDWLSLWEPISYRANFSFTFDENVAIPDENVAILNQV